MPITEKNVSVKKREYVCDSCGQGVLRLTYGMSVLDTNPRQYVHHCTHCKKESYLTVIYPVLEYREKLFMQAESLRYSPREPNSKTSN